MKKSLLALAVGMLLSASVADAATVYFSNDAKVKWRGVYAKVGNEPYAPLAEVKETITGEDAPTELWKYEGEAGSYVQFANMSQVETGFQVTSKLLVEDGAVYNSESVKIGTISGTEFTGIAKGDQVIVNTGWYLVGTMNNYELRADYQFTYENTSTTTLYKKMEYRLTTTIVAGSSFFIEKDGVRYGSNYSINPQFESTGGDEADLVQSEMFNFYEGQPAVKVEKTCKITITFIEGEDDDWNECLEGFVACAYEEPEVAWVGAWKSNNSWIQACEFEKAEGSVDVYTATLEAGSNTSFALFQAVNGQEWNKGIQYMPANSGAGMMAGTTATWTLTPEFELGAWTVTLNQKNNTVDFKWSNASIVVMDKAEELTKEEDGSYIWKGAVGENNEVKFNFDGKYYVLGESTQEYEGNNLVVTYALAEGETAAQFGYDSDDVTFVVNADKNEVVATIAGANTPKMMVGDKAVDLTVSGGAYVAYEVDITADDAISFMIDGKNYVPAISGNVSYEAKTVSYTLAQEDGTASFADVKTVLKDGSEVEFIQDAFKPNVRISSDLTKVTFTWDAETGVEVIAADNSEAVYFNLQGVRVANPENGIFIEVKGGKAVKVLK